MLVSDILSDKGKLVHTCGPDDSLADVVDLLVGHNVGSLVVMEEGEMVGIITERDILRASAATRGPLEFLTVRERMTRCPVVASLQHDVSDVMCVMTERRIRHVPVVVDELLAGIVSIGDAVKHRIGELESETQTMHEYIWHGR
jgi:CBS domain-containing protein